MKPQFEWVRLKGGSTLREHFDSGEALMHSTIGSILESRLLYGGALRTYFSRTGRSPESLWDCGLGMGFSVLAALEDSRTLRKVLSFDRSLEAVRMALEGTEDLELSGFLKKFRHLLQSLVRDGAVLEEGFEWKVELGEFPSVLKVLPEIPAPHLIFYDFYAPSVSPELWQAEVLQEVSRRVSRGSEPTLLVTYVAQGAFRRQLRSLGWKVERAPGTPSKRETTHAWWGSH